MCRKTFFLIYILELCSQLLILTRNPNNLNLLQWLLKVRDIGSLRDQSKFNSIVFLSKQVELSFSCATVFN